MESPEVVHMCKSRKSSTSVLGDKANESKEQNMNNFCSEEYLFYHVHTTHTPATTVSNEFLRHTIERAMPRLSFETREIIISEDLDEGLSAWCSCRQRCRTILHGSQGRNGFRIHFFQGRHIGLGD